MLVAARGRNRISPACRLHLTDRWQRAEITRYRARIDLITSPKGSKNQTRERVTDPFSRYLFMEMYSLQYEARRDCIYVANYCKQLFMNIPCYSESHMRCWVMHVLAQNRNHVYYVLLHEAHCNSLSVTKFNRPITLDGDNSGTTVS